MCRSMVMFARVLWELQTKTCGAFQRTRVARFLGARALNDRVYPTLNFSVFWRGARLPNAQKNEFFVQLITSIWLLFA